MYTNERWSYYPHGRIGGPTTEREVMFEQWRERVRANGREHLDRAAGLSDAAEAQRD